MGNGRITDPMNREEFKLYIRSKLGEPVITLNITEFQVDQAVDDALQWYRDYHYNGTTQEFYAITLTQEDLDRRWVQLPDDITDVFRVYDMADTTGLGISADIYSGAWQLNYDLIFSQGSNSGQFLSFFISKQYYDMINSILVGKVPIRYNMHDGKLYIDSTWTNYREGGRLIVDCWKTIDPDANPKVWSDRWLMRYATALVKRQWGDNVGKFTVPLPGGVQVNYERIIREADEEITLIRDKILQDYSVPPRDLIA